MGRKVCRGHGRHGTAGRTARFSQSCESPAPSFAPAVTNLGGLARGTILVFRSAEVCPPPAAVPGAGAAPSSGSGAGTRRLERGRGSVVRVTEGAGQDRGRG